VTTHIKKDVALGAFLHIEGPFDRTSIHTIKQAAEKHGIEPEICSWICSMLESRNIVTTSSGETLGASVAKGCPQKGMLSPLLWSLAMNDTAILINGKFLQTVSEVLQTSLCTVQQ
jgi:hypothetical protein